MRNVTVDDVERLGEGAARAREDAEAMLAMTEDQFRLFYDRTARPMWLYLMKMTGDAHVADDLLQEAYYRLLRADRPFDSDEHRRNYLYRIATNLARDGRRRPGLSRSTGLDEAADTGGCGDETERAVRRADLGRAMRRLTPRERALLWLAYARGSSHEEIAGSLGVAKGSVKPLLFRARRRLAALLGRV
jgi:RNA polymerase sigma-70 factor (ECF subfamily)